MSRWILLAQSLRLDGGTCFYFAIEHNIFTKIIKQPNKTKQQKKERKTDVDYADIDSVYADVAP